ncbi:hypothetical protein GCM10023189_23730 [Nibrella saemangeumensis]|uniref:DUF4468 domain-containing protein n=2 Tax=Nibrella saemangeumensis TaxID=1084526 RepID=A0ABP8MUK6_9BACT
MVWVSVACASRYNSVQLLGSANELPSAEKAVWVKSIRVNARTIRIVGNDGTTQEVSPVNVWGYRTAGGATYRLYGNRSYELVRTGDIQLYLDRVPDGRVVKDKYYFSLTPDGDLWHLNKKNIRLVFRNNPCVLHRMKEVRTGNLLQTNAQGADNLINAWRECQNGQLTSQ